jgi:hypothetical protein
LNGNIFRKNSWLETFKRWDNYFSTMSGAGCDSSF